MEYEKFRRVVDYMATTHYSQDKLDEGRKDFYNWFNTLDQRRDTKFLDNFPEYAAFYNECEIINAQLR